MLPQSSEVAEHLPIWRRPLGPLLWVTVIAGAVIGLVVAATVFERLPVEFERVPVYGRAARRMHLDGELVIDLTLDTGDNMSSQQDEMLKDVSLRLSRSTLEKFDFVSLEPTPDSVLRSGSGRYLQYDTLSRETQLQLTMRPRQTGTHNISIGVFARDHYPSLPYTITVRVLPPVKRPVQQPKKPLSVIR